MTDNYLYFITALMPLAACILVIQTNPYDALVMRGILGGVSAMLYAVFGAADVALTEALVGTMLSVTLYAVAVRSSLVMRLGVVKDELVEAEAEHPFRTVIEQLREIFRKRFLRLELVPYLDREELQQALIEKEVHGICIRGKDGEEKPVYDTVVRLHRLYEILQTEVSTTTNLSYKSYSDLGGK
ncbi:DUF4040 domain-containing protein [Ancylothrix sp. C2]|uniref:DUF4040 domain-containing protein n=1 Tax=Ancylothrix sp. D3o TaxID=2953691 RepID=UPI0021BB0D77|nr:DUF4040 domain-containing protein [Ancylothrix sp. D3o]MCT7949294.1 DUF4040 domain-containing protein [Ancylothrix sp. D3o]